MKCFYLNLNIELHYVKFAGSLQYGTLGLGHVMFTFYENPVQIQNVVCSKFMLVLGLVYFLHKYTCKHAHLRVNLRTVC